MKQHIRAKKGGYQCSPKNSTLKHITFLCVSLKRGEKKVISLKRKEAILTLLSGEVTIETPETAYRLGPRRDVFSEKSHSLFVGADDTISIRACRASEIVVVTTAKKKKTRTYCIRPSDVQVRNVGRETYQRKVHDIVSETMDGSVLLAGETFNKPGQWSSFPPHKHDLQRMPRESLLEEVYFFKVKPKDRFGLIYVYSAARGKRIGTAYAVENNDVVCIPQGYHPVSAPPGTQVYYFWALAGSTRALRMSEDSAFKSKC